MGICFSATKVSGSNGTTANAAANKNRKRSAKRKSKTATANPQRHKACARNVPCGMRTDFGYEKDFQKRYTLGKLLGHGQFGYTYVGIHKANGDHVAVKRLEKSKMVQPIAVEDVKREVKILKALTGHENVVQFYNAFEDDSYVYIVMELCEGGELLDRILAKKDSRYTEKDAAVVVRQMLKVAAECHLHGLVHRDMKPENFLFKSTEEDSPLKATDFGLSDFIKPGKKFNDIVGSAYYVAPEVLKRKSGPQSDVWSIGVITYILLCGRRPFWDKTEDGIFKEVLRKKPDFSRKPWPTISNAAIDFVEKLLVKDPQARLTAAQALSALHVLYFSSKASICYSTSPKNRSGIGQVNLQKSNSHPWVREGGEALEIPIDISVLNNMRQFVKYSRLKQFALRALASTINEEELADLKDQFDAIDEDKNGSISLEEMRQALAKDLPWKLKESRVLEILQAIDSNTDGLVDFSEFVAATLHVRQLEENSDKWQQRSQAAFEKFDLDKNGYITPEELRMVGLRGSIDPLLEEADIDKDGKISLSEFRRLLRNASIGSQKFSSPNISSVLTIYETQAACGILRAGIISTMSRGLHQEVFGRVYVDPHGLDSESMGRDGPSKEALQVWTVDPDSYSLKEEDMFEEIEAEASQAKYFSFPEVDFHVGLKFGRERDIGKILLRKNAHMEEIAFRLIICLITNPTLLAEVKIKSYDIQLKL
ncbi:unnamed protein product [Sphenostylis stenocarpa]|uniref:non-specific serine/threonine protein kinase n=1 Tax=Sphenostylis stenocarpa TaxID=92480 RepID=A0AA86S5H4_9FABA|nr:unnamed protein product [Sphenostylis stenocarpa]